MDKTLSQYLADLLTKPIQKLHEFGAKGWWQSLLVVALVGAAGGLADREFGKGNPVSKELAAPAVSTTTAP